MAENETPLIINTDSEQENPIVKPLEINSMSSKLPLLVVLTVTITLGILSGKYLANSNQSSLISLPNQSQNSEKLTSKSVIVGSTDTKTFKDCASGQLVKNDGKITNEGSHKLLRDGGESQSIYLTSSVVDLDQFIEKKVQICGETNTAQKAGWLMDVGRVITQ